MKNNKFKKRKNISEYIMALLMMFIFAYSGCNGKEDDVITTYTITFDADGGSPVPSAQSVEAGELATAPTANPTKTGYVFLFWHLNGVSTAYDFNTPVTGNITLLAKWEEEAKVESWQVTWELNGGSWPATGDNHATKVAKNGKLAAPAEPVKSGTILAGWYKDEALTNLVNFPYDVSAVTANFTLYAKWEDPSKAAYFGTWRHVGTFEGDPAFWEQITIFNYNGYDIIEWEAKTGYGFTLFFNDWTERNNTAGSYTATYPKGYRVVGSMNSNQGYNIPKSTGSGVAQIGDKALTSYYISADKQSIMAGNFSTTAQEAAYGPYRKIAPVESWSVYWFTKEGSFPWGFYPKSSVYKDGSVLAPLQNPTKKGYIFDGWYRDYALKTKVKFPYSVSSETGNIDFWAKWAEPTPSATLKVTIMPTAGTHTIITAQRQSAEDGFVYSANIPGSVGTHSVNVLPGTYRLAVTYLATPTSTPTLRWSSYFSVSSGETRNITVTNGSVGFP